MDRKKLMRYSILCNIMEDLKKVQNTFECGKPYFIDGEGCKASAVSIKQLLAFRSEHIKSLKSKKEFQEEEFKDMIIRIEEKVAELEEKVGKVKYRGSTAYIMSLEQDEQGSDTEAR